MYFVFFFCFFFFFKQKTAYEMVYSDWSSDVCSSDLLEETLVADVVLHVADASAPDDRLEQQIDAVETVLAEIGADEVPVELVLNKIDLVDPLARRRLGNRFPAGLQVSAETGEGLPELRERIAGRFADRFDEVRL